tara:strand:- start:4698 stop:5198 length:501 start_codon:yes stop_codon:yes gene_type:complete
MIRTFFLLFLLSINSSFAASMKMIGEKGKKDEVTREVTVKMYDNYYVPNSIKVKRNETVRFVVENMGELVHEYNIATKEMHLKHQPEMQKMVEMEIILADKIDEKKMKEMAKIDHAMAHKHANSLLLEPKEKGEIIWKFSTSAKLEIACNVPGHYEAGMIARINQD